MTHSEAHQINQSNPIVRIIINNFQSHSKTILDPAPSGQLTVIVGQSRQGKTAIFRALRWLFYNAPDGDEFIRWGTTFASVSVAYADGTVVERYRTKGGKNQYIIRKMDCQDQVYEGFGRGAVPLEVQQVTGVSPVEIGDVKSGQGVTLNLNLAEQLDGPFLGNKSVSSTMRAKVLGKLAGTEEVDLASKTLGTDIFRWRQEEKRLNGDPEKHIDGEIQDTQKKLDGYKYLPELRANMDKLSGIRDAVKAAMDRREKLSTLYQEYTQVSFRANDERLKMLRCRDLIEKMIPAVESIEVHMQSVNRLNQTKIEWDKNSASILATESTIRKTQGLSQAEELLRAAEGRFGRQQQAETIITRWNKTVYDITQADKIIDGTQGIYTSEALIDSIRNDSTRRNKAKEVSAHWAENAKLVTETNWIINKTKDVHNAESSLADMYSSVDRKIKLAMLYGKWDQSKDDMAVVEKQLERTKGIEGAGALLNIAENNITNHQRFTDLIWALDANKKSIMTESILAENAGEEVEKFQTKYYEALKQAGKCPLCGNSVDREKLMEVI